MSDHFPLSHTCSLRLGSTILELHIHPGIETCDECEPGLVQAKLAEDTPKGYNDTFQFNHNFIIFNSWAE